MRCPFCASTDIADLVKGGRVCLDCDNTWLTKTDRLLGIGKPGS